MLAQTFTAGLTGPLDRLSLYMFHRHCSPGHRQRRQRRANGHDHERQPVSRAGALVSRAGDVRRPFH